MNKFAFALLSSAVVAIPNMGASGYSRGVPPTTQNCNSYPLIISGATVGSGNFARQDQAWGLEEDREFGGCSCADESEMEFQPNPLPYEDNTWACRCLNNDLYLAQPNEKYLCYDTTTGVSGVNAAVLTNGVPSCTAPEVPRLDDNNGKKCGVTQECQDAAVVQQTDRWSQEKGRAIQTKESAREIAKKSLMPEDEIARSRILRSKMTKENRARARV